MTAASVGGVAGAAGGAVSGFTTSVLSGDKPKDVFMNTLGGAWNGLKSGAMTGGLLGGFGAATSSVTGSAARYAVDTFGETAVDTIVDVAQGGKVTPGSIMTSLSINAVTEGISARAAKGSKADVNTSKPKGGEVSPQNSRQEISTNVDNVLRKNADPMASVLGPGKDSHPKEWNRILSKLENDGVEIVYREGVFGYSPSKGQAGQMLIDENASITALMHEYQHYVDDKVADFPGMEYHFQTKNRLKMELNAYMKEIHFAESIGRKDTANELFKNYMDERNLLTSHLYRGQ